jgi:hypothetical protein
MWRLLSMSLWKEIWEDVQDLVELGTKGAYETLFEANDNYVPTYEKNRYASQITVIARQEYHDAKETYERKVQEINQMEKLLRAKQHESKQTLAVFEKKWDGVNETFRPERKQLLREYREKLNLPHQSIFRKTWKDEAPQINVFRVGEINSFFMGSRSNEAQQNYEDAQAYRDSVRYKVADLERSTIALENIIQVYKSLLIGINYYNTRLVALIEETNGKVFGFLSRSSLKTGFPLYVALYAFTNVQVVHSGEITDESKQLISFYLEQERGE